MPLPPLKAVEEITYLDRAGDQQTLPSEDYHVAGIGPVRIIPCSSGIARTATALRALSLWRQATAGAQRQDILDSDGWPIDHATSPGEGDENRERRMLGDRRGEPKF